MAGMFDGVTAHMNEMMTGVRKQINTIAPSAPGQRERSPQEEAAMWRELSKLPEDELRGMTRDLIKRAGHSPYEEQPCELCLTIAKHGLGEE